MKLDIDLANVKVEQIEDILCQDKDGNFVHNKDGEPFILTDGTGYISEDLVVKCPKNIFKGSVVNGDNVEGKFSGMKSTESHHRVPPLLVQFRLFYNGYAVKGTLLVNKKLPPKTIQVRPSMIKVKPDPNLSNICTRNSLEVVKTSNQPRRTSLSRNLIMLLRYGGVPDDFFMDILKNAIEESQAVFSNKRSALKVSLNRGGMDDLNAAKMILSGIPLDEPYLQLRLSIMMNEERKGLLGGKLPMTDSYYLMGTVDPSRVLESDEVCIILYLLDYFRVSEPWIENLSTCGVSSKEATEFSDGGIEDELFKLFLRTRFRPSYAMSIAADNWLAIMDRLLTLEDSNSTEKVLVKQNLLRLIDLYYEALDAPKTGKKIEVPEELRVSVFPHYMERENSFKSTSILGKIYDFVKSHNEEVSRRIEVQKLPCFDGGFSEDSKDKWIALYDLYRIEMKNALGGESKDQAANSVNDKYKQILYEAAEFEQTERPLDEIHDEALAIYNISYDYAMRLNDVAKCGFAWKIASSALLSLYASKQREKVLSCTPSVLKELFA